jgi:hypothetical protein
MAPDHPQGFESESGTTAVIFGTDIGFQGGCPGFPPLHQSSLRRLQVEGIDLARAHVAKDEGRVVGAEPKPLPDGDHAAEVF